MPLKIEDDNLLVKYNEIWNKIKKMLNIKLHSQPVYDEKYIKNKIKTFNELVLLIQFFQTMKFQKKLFIKFVLQQWTVMLSWK